MGGVAVPVGLAWKLALEADPTLPLYGPDGYHPAPGGSLLAALTIYDRVFGRDVREIPVAALASLSTPALGSARLEVLATAAHAAATSLPPDPTRPYPPIPAASRPQAAPAEAAPRAVALSTLRAESSSRAQRGTFSSLPRRLPPSGMRV